jgi:transposase
MATAYQLVLSDGQRRELEAARRGHPKAYVREKAAALLKVADGQAIRQVALFGLLRMRHPETVSDWIRDYQQQGLAGLQVQAGRGRKPAFSPSTRHRRGRPA